jgi:hypothetical protein
MANRYQELLAEIPKGSFYASTGEVLPFRGESPYEFRYETNTANTRYGIFVNDVFSGLVTTDALGVAVVSIKLGLGRQAIVLRDENTDAKFRAYVTTRHYATIMAAQADALETVEARIDDIQNALGLETVGPNYIEDIYGRQLRQPNDVDYPTDDYRNLLRSLRQAFRIWGARRAGTRQVVHAFTDFPPLLVPRAWRPAWRLGYQLFPNEDFLLHARRVANQDTQGVFPLLNARSFNLVHADFADDTAGGPPTPFPGPFGNPPTPERLQVTLDANWNGGDITVTGTNPQDEVISETFSGAVPSVSLLGLLVFKTVTAATKSAIGSGTQGFAKIGVADGRFVRIVSIGGLNTLTAYTLFYLATPDRLRWTATGVEVDISSSSFPSGSGRVTLREIDRAADYYSLIPEPAGGGGYVLGTDDRFLAFELDAKGIVWVDLANASFAGAAGNRTALQIEDTARRHIRRDERYGAVAATATITLPTGTALSAFADGTLLITLNDGVTPDDAAPANVDLDLRQAGPATAGKILVLYLAGDTAPQVAAKVAQAILTGSNDGAGAAPSALQGLRLTASSALAVVSLRNDLGGTQGNQTITLSANAISAGVTKTNFTGGANSTDYATAITAVTGVGTNLARVFRFNRGSGASPVGPSSTVRLWPIGAEATKTVLGEPRVSALLQTAITAANLKTSQVVSLDLPTANRFDPIRETTVIHAAVLDTSGTTTTAFSAPSHPTALEVYFDGAWRGGTVRVRGTAFGTGAAMTEDFVPPTSTVLSGVLNATSTGSGVTVTLAGGALFTGVQAGMFFRVGSGGLSGTGAYIRFVNAALTSIVLYDTGLGADITSQSFTITRDVKAQGVEAFATVTQMQVLTTPVAGTAGQATLMIIDADEHGYLVRIGRSLRASGSNWTITLTSDPKTATFTAAGLSTELADEGGYLLIGAADAGGRTGVNDGTNNGLHLIMNVTEGGITSLTIRHQQALTGGRFVAEANATATYRVYGAGDLVRVIAKNTGNGDLTLYPPGVPRPFTTTALVALASSMPTQVEGLLGPGTITLDVNRAFLPTGATSNAVTLVGTEVPDGWRVYNASATNMAEGGYFRSHRLQMTASGADGSNIGTTNLVVEITLRSSDVVLYRGLRLRATFWVQQHVVTTARNFRIDFAFNDGAFVAGTAVVLGASANPEPVLGTHLSAADGGGALDPEVVQAEAEIPYNATRAQVRLIFEGAAATENVSVEHASLICTVTHGSGFEDTVGFALHTGLGTVAPSAHQAFFGEFLHLYSPSALTAPERTDLGVPMAPSSVPSVEGQIDRIVNAHGYWAREDVSEYDGLGNPLNPKGVFTEIDWLAATLTNLEIVFGTPVRFSYLRPTRISMVTGEVLAFIAPSNATLAQTSSHEGLFPQSANTRGDRLYAAGVPVPASALTGQRATATIGAALGANGTIVITTETEGTAGNSYTVQVTVPAGTAKLAVTLTGTAIVVALSVVGGVPVANENRAIRIAKALDDLPGFTATHLPGTGASAFTAAEGPTAFLNGDPTPWRFTAASTIQVASIAAGDSATFVEYDPAKAYTIDYEVLMRAESAVIDLGTSWADYLWYADAAIDRRTEPEIVERERTEQLLFDGDFRATLSEHADTDTTTAVLIKDTGIKQEQVSVTNWGFIDSQTVEIDASVFDPDAIFAFTYQAKIGRFPRVASVRLETRSATTSLGVASAVYREVALGELVDHAHEFHQLRLTITGVVDVRDIRVRSMGFRGVRLYGTAPRAPGILVP